MPSTSETSTTTQGGSFQIASSPKATRRAPDRVSLAGERLAFPRGPSTATWLVLAAPTLTRRAPAAPAGAIPSSAGSRRSR